MAEFARKCVCTRRVLAGADVVGMGSANSIPARLHVLEEGGGTTRVATVLVAGFAVELLDDGDQW